MTCNDRARAWTEHFYIFTWPCQSFKIVKERERYRRITWKILGFWRNWYQSARNYNSLKVFMLRHPKAFFSCKSEAWKLEAFNDSTIIPFLVWKSDTDKTRTLNLNQVSGVQRHIYWILTMVCDLLHLRMVKHWRVVYESLKFESSWGLNFSPVCYVWPSS